MPAAGRKEIHAMADEIRSETKPGGATALDYDEIRSIVKQLADAIVQSKAAPDPDAADSDDRRTKLRFDYQITVDVIKLLSDIRFRCLVFVTAVIAVANALLPGAGDPGARIALGFVGFLTTLGIAVYELRNSQLYDAAIHRAKAIETELDMERTSEESPKGGLFNERPLYVETTYWKNLEPEQRKTLISEHKVQVMSFWFVEVKHDRGLAFIYGAVLGGWVYLVADGLLSLPPPGGYWPPAPNGWARIISALIGIAAFVLSVTWFLYHDKWRFKPSPKEPEAPRDKRGAPASRT